MNRCFKAASEQFIVVFFSFLCFVLFSFLLFGCQLSNQSLKLTIQLKCMKDRVDLLIESLMIRYRQLRVDFGSGDWASYVCSALSVDKEPRGVTKQLKVEGNLLLMYVLILNQMNLTDLN